MQSSFSFFGKAYLESKVRQAAKCSASSKNTLLIAKFPFSFPNVFEKRSGVPPLCDWGRGSVCCVGYYFILALVCFFLWLIPDLQAVRLWWFSLMFLLKVFIEDEEVGVTFVLESCGCFLMVFTDPDVCSEFSCHLSPSSLQARIRAQSVSTGKIQKILFYTVICTPL